MTGETMLMNQFGRNGVILEKNYFDKTLKWTKNVLNTIRPTFFSANVTPLKRNPRITLPKDKFKLVPGAFSEITETFYVKFFS